VSAPEDRPGIGILLGGLASLLFACMDATVKHLTAELDTPMILWARYLFHVLLILAVLAPTGSTRLFRARRPGLQFVRSVLLFGATACFFTALRSVPLAEASSILFLAPVLVTAFSVPFLGEKVGLRRWSAVVAGFLGVLLIIRPGMSGHSLAILLPLGSATCYSLYLIATRVINRTDQALTTLLYSTLAGSVVLCALLPWFWQAPSPQAWAFMLLLGLIGASGHYIMILALRFTQASAIAPFMYLQLVAAVTFGVTLFGETPDAVAMIGTVFIVASGLYVWHRERSLAARAAR
jgi:drug/metabolite transporter (DMT)-like permease